MSDLPKLRDTLLGSGRNAQVINEVRVKRYYLTWARMCEGNGQQNAAKLIRRLADEQRDELERQRLSALDLVRLFVALKLSRKAVALRDNGRDEEAIAVLDKLIDRFGGASAAPLRKRVAWALRTKGGLLLTKNRSEEAFVVFENLLDRFGDALEEQTRNGLTGAIDRYKHPSHYPSRPNILPRLRRPR